MSSLPTEPSPPEVTLDAIPPAPRRPSAEARNLIFRYQGSQKVLLILGVVFALTGVPFTLVFCWGLPVDILIALGSRTVQGTLTEAFIDQSMEVNGEHPLAMRYRYQVGSTAFTGQSSLTEYRDGEVPGAGQPVTVEHSTLCPGFSRVEGTMRAPFGWFGVFTLLFPAVGVTLWWVAVRSNRREIRAFRHGQAVLARVTFAGLDTSTRINGRHPYMVRWSFRVGAQEYAGQISHMNQALVRPLADQPRLAVLYLPDDPRANTVWVA